MKQRGVAKPIMKPAPVPTPPAPRNVELEVTPSFYLSNVTKQILEGEIGKGTITQRDLPFIFKTAKAISHVFGLHQPSLPDVVGALYMRTPENLQAIAEGNVELHMFRPELGRKMHQSKAERVALWKNVAVAILQNNGNPTK